MSKIKMVLTTTFLLISILLVAPSYAQTHPGGNITSRLKIDFREIPSLSAFRITCDLKADKDNVITLQNTGSSVFDWFDASMNGELFTYNAQLEKGDNKLVVELVLKQAFDGMASLTFIKFDDLANDSVTECSAVPYPRIKNQIQV